MTARGNRRRSQVAALVALLSLLAAWLLAPREDRAELLRAALPGALEAGLQAVGDPPDTGPTD